MVAKLFDEIAPKYADRNGGYTRIVRSVSVKVTLRWKFFIELV